MIRAINGKNVGKMDRKPLISDKGVKQIHDLVTKKSVELKASYSECFESALKKKIQDERATNSYTPVDNVNISAQSVLNYKRKCEVIERVGKVKSISRSGESKNCSRKGR